MATKSKADQPKVETFPNGWSLVTAGTWQISVAPDGLLMLPRHLHPREVSDFLAAAVAAAEEGERIVKENQENEKPVPELTGQADAVVTEGPPPPGLIPMTVSGGPNQPPTGSIGRRSGRARNPQTNPLAMPGMSRNARRR
jgi:hypothetical protein